MKDNILGFFGDEYETDESELLPIPIPKPKRIKFERHPKFEPTLKQAEISNLPTFEVTTYEGYQNYLTRTGGVEFEYLCF